MPLYINTNINSLVAQRNLNRSQDAMSQALERLSSGLRINSAADDAAGLAIATRFTTQINGLNQAIRNSNDGVSLAQTTESALAQVTDNLQRVRELAVQAANATNSPSDRAALNQEVEQRIAEITRIATQTTFNGLQVLDGSFGQATFQVGANVGDTISINLSQGVGSNQIGSLASVSATVSGTGLAAGELKLQVGDGPVTVVGTSASGSAKDIATAIEQANISGLTATASSSFTSSGLADVTGTAAGDTYSLSVNGEAIYTNADVSTTTLTKQDIVNKINGANAGVTASLDGGEITLSNNDGETINISQTLGGAAAGGFASGTVTEYGEIDLTAGSNITVSGSNPANAGLTASTVAVDTSQQLNDTDVLTVADANETILRVDAALQSVSGLRSTLGAIQNRFQSTISNLQAITTNLVAARSRIQDADFAKETAALTRAQILQSAGISVLSQANATPRAVLQLLQ